MIEVSTRLTAPAADVWARVVSEEGINDELRPVLRMTMPPALRGKTIDDVPTGKRLGRSWILLAGLLPVEYDDLYLAELEPGRRFRERSSMAALRVWTHERTVVPDGDAVCVVTDGLGWEPRAPLARIPGHDRVIGAIVGFLFRHRHRRLARYWGSSPAA